MCVCVCVCVCVCLGGGQGMLPMCFVGVVVSLLGMSLHPGIWHFGYLAFENQ